MSLFKFKTFIASTLFVILIALFSASCITIEDFSIFTKVEKGEINYNSYIELRYQYSKLSKKEKQVYSDILNAVYNGDRSVTLSDYNISSNTCEKVLEAVLCDSPDIFWLSKNYSLVFDDEQVESVYFKYFDGATVDSFELDSNGTIVYSAKADQTLIRDRIEKLNQKLEVKIGELSDYSTSDAVIEMHNSIAQEVSYNHDASDFILSNTNYKETKYFDAFNIYGALMNGSAVCEGYSKLFQYLCLMLDINCTQVSGTYQNQGHMWNAVYITDSWYFVDVTFDDIDSGEIPYVYSYLNIDYNTLIKTHTIDYSALSVPNCGSDRLNYCKNNLINVSNNKISSDYQEKISKEIQSNSKYIIIYFPDADYSDRLLKKLIYYIKPSIKDCIQQCNMQIDRVVSVDKDYAVIFIKNNEV